MREGRRSGIFGIGAHRRFEPFQGLVSPEKGFRALIAYSRARFARAAGESGAQGAGEARRIMVVLFW
jgi:hypothetical protein